MKIKVLDTNILLENRLEILMEQFTETEGSVKLVIPLAVIMELDTFKKGSETIHYNCRRNLFLLESLRKKARLEGKRITDGVECCEGCSLQISGHENIKLDPRDVDSSLILTASEFGSESEIVTLDLHARILADIHDVNAASFEDEADLDECYNGVVHMAITEGQLQDFQKDYVEGCFFTKRKLHPNQLAIMTDPCGAKHYGIYNAEKRCIQRVNNNMKAWGIRPKKDSHGEVVAEQMMLMHLLLDPKIEFVSVVGPSGSGKTLLAMACGLEQVISRDMYSKMIIMRPLTALDRDLGALPGDKFEKLEPWMASSFDNLEFLIESHKPKQLEGALSTREAVYDLMASGMVELEALTYIRGRSIPNQFIVVDDSQNLSAHQATTIITRAGEGSKVIFLGDISKQQIDNHRLNPYNNGLTHVVKNFRGADSCIAHITMETVVRSRLSSLGVKLL